MVRFYYDVVLGLVHWDFKQSNLPNYSEDKHKWVIFNNGMDKKKVRNYISDKAKRIANVSMANHLDLRSIFIEAYNIDGIQAVDRVYKDTVKKLLKNANA